MSPPDERFVRGVLTAFDTMRLDGNLIAYPAKLAGIEVIVLGRIVPTRGSPGTYDSAPYFVVVNDQISAALDITEAQS